MTPPPEPALDHELEYQRRIAALEARVRDLSDHSKSTEEYLQRRNHDDEEVQQLVAYLLKVVVRMQQYTNTLMRKTPTMDATFVRTYLEHQGYKCSGGESEKRALQRFLQGTEHRTNLH